MRLLLSSILLLSVSTFASSDQKWECKSGTIRYKYFGNYKTEKSNYCYDSNKTRLQSYSCKEKICVAFERDLLDSFNEDSLYRRVGKPGFKLCRVLGGIPQIIEFNVANNWFKLDRCLFEDDSSYIDTGTLMEKYLKNN